MDPCLASIKVPPPRVLFTSHSLQAPPKDDNTRSIFSSPSLVRRHIVQKDVAFCSISGSYLLILSTSRLVLLTSNFRRLTLGNLLEFLPCQIQQTTARVCCSGRRTSFSWTVRKVIDCGAYGSTSIDGDLFPSHHTDQLFRHQVR